jgi:hypothetical protein
VTTLQGEEQANRHEFTRIQARLRMLGQGRHRVIDKAEHLDNNLQGGHEASPFSVEICKFSL